MKHSRTLLTAFLLALALFFALSSGKIYEKTVFSFAETKTVYLTFDDGPSDRVTPLVLDVLKKEKVPATFFLVGAQMEERENLVKRIYAEGHAIGIHTYTHEYRKIYASAESLLTDIERTRRKIESLTGISPTIYRFPGGSFSVREELKKAVKKAGYTYIDWNCCCRDEELARPTAKELYEATVNTAEGKNQVVLLCHDSTTHRATAEALPSIISYFRDRGFVFAKLS